MFKEIFPISKLNDILNNRMFDLVLLFFYIIMIFNRKIHEIKV